MPKLTAKLVENLKDYGKYDDGDGLRLVIRKSGIARARGAVESSVADLTTERPYFCYPLGTQAEDPEALITFKATVAVPTQGAGPDRLRGQIIINFFGLNAREQLHRDRARMITVFGPALLAQQQGQASASDLDLIARIDSPNLPHANCLRAFKRLWASDATMARQVFEQCRVYMLSELGTPLPRFGPFFENLQTFMKLCTCIAGLGKRYSHRTSELLKHRDLHSVHKGD